MASWNSPVRRRQSASRRARFRSEGWARWSGFELGGRFGDLKGLVVGQPQVEAESRSDVAGGHLQGSLILIDGILVAAEFGQDGAQIGTRLHAVGLGGNAGLVGADGTLKITCLMQLNCTIQRTLGVQ